MGIQKSGRTKDQFQKAWQEKRDEAVSRVDLKAVLESRYGLTFFKNGTRQFKVEQDLRHGGERLGIFQRADVAGRPCWVTQYGPPLQTVVALDRELNGQETSMKEAGNILMAGPVAASEFRAQGQAAHRPNQPIQATGEAAQACYEYLKCRGIDRSTARDASADGFLVITAHGPCFTGYNGSPQADDLRCTETRLIKPIEKEGETVSKLVARGSSRDYPAKLPGKGELHIVEGGIDALALREMLNNEGRDGTIVATGGKDCRNWLTTECGIHDAKSATSVTIWSENESSAEKQEDTNEANFKMHAAIVEIRGGSAGVMIKRPPAGVKDVAEWNLNIKLTRQIDEPIRSKSIRI